MVEKVSMKEILTSEIKKAKAKEYIDIFNKQQYKQTKDKNQSYNNQSQVYFFEFPLNESQLSLNKINKPKQKKKEPTIYEKGITNRLLRESKLEEERYQKKMSEINSLQRPIINHNSLEMASKMRSRSNLPLHQRTYEIREQYDSNLEHLRDYYNNHYYNNDNANYANKPKNKRTEDEFNNWINDNEEWNNFRKEKIDIKREERSRKEYESNENNATFKPSINGKSHRIIEQKNLVRNSSALSMRSSRGYNSISERLYQNYFDYEKHKKELRRQLTPSFTPMINTSNDCTYKKYMYVIDDNPIHQKMH